MLSNTVGTVHDRQQASTELEPADASAKLVLKDELKR